MNRKVLMFFSCLSLFFSQNIFANENLDKNQEKQILRSFIETYNKAKTPFELRKRLSTLSEINSDQAAYLFGENYFKPLPKLSFNLDKMELILGKTVVQFTNLSEGEAKINGKLFKYDLNATFTQNYSSLLEGNGRKTSFLEMILINKAYAGMRFTSKDGTRISTLRETAGINGPDVDLYSGVERLGSTKMAAGFASAAGASVAGLAGSAFGMVTLAGIIPLHYGVKKAHAYMAPSCEKQTLEIAEIMNRDGISISGLNCTGYLTNDNSSINFWRQDKQSMRVFANWDKQEAWVGPDQLLKFDRTQLTEVREIRYNELYQDKKTGETYYPKSQIKIFKEGSEDFKKIKQAVEPFRKVLSVFGRYESCHKCEAYFNENLVQDSPAPYNLTALREKAGVTEGSQTPAIKKSVR